MKQSLIFYFLIFFSGISCIEQRKEFSTSINDSRAISLEAEFSNEISYSDFFAQISFIYLNTPQNEFVGSINKIFLQEGIIAILDLAQSTVWLFTENGDYISKFTAGTGRGPGEIMQFSDAFFAGKNSIALVGAFKILIYDVLTGSLTAEFIKPTFAPRFDFLEQEEKIIAFTANGLLDGTNSHNLIFIDSLGTKVGQLLPIDQSKKKLALIAPRNFYVLNDTLHHFSFIDYNIYSLASSNELNIKYKLELGRFKIPEESFDKVNTYDRPTDFVGAEIYEKGYPVITTALESERYFLLNFMFAKDRKRGHILFDKKENETYSSIGITNDLYPELDFYFTTSDNSYFYGFEEFGEIWSYISEKQPNHPQFDYLKNISDQKSNITNPILVRGRTKE